MYWYKGTNYYGTYGSSYNDFQALSGISPKFSMHSKRLLSATLAYSAVVNAIPATTTPAPQPSVTLYYVEASGAEIASGGTTKLDITVVGVSTGSAGTETTYSFGEYLSLPATTIAIEGSSSNTVDVLPSQVVTQNYTVVESSAGAFLSLSNSMYVETQSCSYASDGGLSGSCVDVIVRTMPLMGPKTTTVTFGTFSAMFEGTKVPFTVLAAPTSTSLTSDAVKPRTGIHYLNLWMGGIFFMSWFLQ
ncbi:hypothetical protein BDP27DRAFT_1424327 [Rhodocollybia butyracea]|uniref:Uncharacterized protein n=1 Tax=Rhodocollybia butyracea TaxID=206335 RepID=A0A9P5U3Q3_9AGAR|nr:hypothetical protein BDP27DRAFT_1424327 [Rhodocollybia butyracea]